jgi:hypothetical protein
MPAWKPSHDFSRADGTASAYRQARSHGFFRIRVSDFCCIVLGGVIVLGVGILIGGA